MSVVGIDGCKSGWIAVVLGDAGPVAARQEAHHLPTIEAVGEVVADAEVIGIDIPIGFSATMPREADAAARLVLGPRRSSVFLTPPREVLAAAPYAVANQLSIELTGHGISRQAYGLAAKIFEVERWLPAAPCRVVEVHPEVTFTTMLGHPATHSKKTWAGMVERRDALARAGIVLDGPLGVAGASAAVDDVLDAAAVAWTARRVAAGTADCHPAGADVDVDAVAIWA